jgi:hypothetical protein
MSRRPSKLPATLIEAQEAAIMQHAREALKAARGAFVDGDPFERSTMHAAVRATFKKLAQGDERDALQTLQAATAGLKDAHDALVGLIGERSNPMGPGGGALPRSPQRARSAALSPTRYPPTLKPPR